MNTKDYLRVRAIEKQAKIVTCRNSLINQKPVGKLSFTTDVEMVKALAMSVRHHSSDKCPQGMQSLLLSPWEECIQITGWLKWKLISHEVS